MTRQPSHPQRVITGTADYCATRNVQYDSSTLHDSHFGLWRRYMMKQPAFI